MTKMSYAINHCSILNRVTITIKTRVTIIYKAFFGSETECSDNITILL